ncbi:polysaccharide biosynthesis tyrosine autokinase [Acuticoccus sp. M5D2P5]|uniref:GumC family protein n=1 Tax=Acuticoccus kalidii TaxID=2910977 RepID=UPI001F41AFBC|nr:polysaccharide biosynthesis tyrosine autokinase [Acuticoccus kalidii]MCF3933006.1 polysaccharide biosynthesis tyrosine autokinase [Acuticoccus kalidii]
MTIVPFAQGEPLRIDTQGPAEGGLDLRAVLAFTWRGRWILLVSVFVGLTLAAIHVAGVQPTYTATATVLFGPQDLAIAARPDAPRPPPLDAVRNQIEVLRSTSLLTKVVEALDLAGAAPATEREGGGGFFGLSRLVPWTFLANLGLAGRTDLGQVTDAARHQRAVDAARRRLADIVSVAPVPHSRVIRIKAKTANADRSARIANEVARQYVTARLDAKLDATREATRWLNDRVAELRVELEEAEAAVANFNADLVGRVGESAAASRQRLGALNQDQARASARRASAEIRLGRAKTALANNESIASVPVFAASDTIARYHEQELTLLGDRATLAKLVPDGHERLDAIDTRIESARSTIRKEAGRVVATLESEVEIARAEEAEFAAKVRAIESQLRVRDRSEIQLRQLEREADANRLLYENFLGRLKETTQQETLEEADAVILSPADAPTFADSESTKRTLALGATVGGAFGFVLLILLERLNRTFRSFDEVQQLTGLPLLGAIPQLAGEQGRNDVIGYVYERPASALAEAVRSLRTSLLFSKIDHPPQVVMVTSTVPDEGKSTTSLLLAMTSAQMGKSAIIVDCDLRRPSLHLGIGEGTAGAVGLRDVLDGSVSLDEACRREEDTGLFVLTSQSGGQLAVNAADILASDRFAAIIGELRARFDLVILDTPPILSVTDGRVVAPLVDAVLYCVRWDHTAREAVAEGLRELSLVKSRAPGMVVTRVDVDKVTSLGFSNYGSSYFRGYRSDKYYED